MFIEEVNSLAERIRQHIHEIGFTLVPPEFEWDRWVLGTHYCLYSGHTTDDVDGDRCGNCAGPALPVWANGRKTWHSVPDSGPSFVTPLAEGLATMDLHVPREDR